MSQEMSFETGIEKINQILGKLENKNTTLSESLSLFDEAVALTAKCDKILSDAHQKVTALQVNSDGTVEESPFENS